MSVVIERNNSLSTLGYKIPNAGQIDSALVNRSRLLFKKPLNEFEPEDLRILIGQNVALEILVPMAIDVLADTPFVQGDYYPGDLLQSLLSIESWFWRMNPILHSQFVEILGPLPGILETLKRSIDSFSVTSVD